MVFDDRKDAQPVDEDGITSPSQSMPTRSVGVSEDESLTQQMLKWLELPTVREQRRYLEAHLDLLNSENETLLKNLIAQKTEQPEKVQQYCDALLLLQDIQRRGRATEAVREAYIDRYGGFIFDLPPWLEAVNQRLADLREEKQRHYTAKARYTLLQETLERVQDNPAFAPELVATLRWELAVALWEYLHDRDRMLETALSLCEKSLTIYTIQRYPHQYAKAQRVLGGIYLERIAGERRENLEQAIVCYQEGLRVYTLEAFPFDYALNYNNLGVVYRERIAGERRENLEQAIVCYQEALRVYTLETFPFDYARAQNNLGLVYWQRIEGERRENLERAIACYQEALHVHTLEVFPYEYAMAQNNLGLAYWERIAGERRENLEHAIVCYQEALRVRTLETYSYGYAHTQSNLSRVYLYRVAGKQQENLERAIVCCQEALRVYTLQAFPFEYAEVQNNLGTVYVNRIVGKRLDNLKLAMACYQEALSVYTVSAFPFDYASSQNDLGFLYQQLALVQNMQVNLKQGLICFSEALRVYTSETFPHDFRSVQLNIAETEALLRNWSAVHKAYSAALEAEDLLVALGAGQLGRDAILREGHDAAIRNGYALHHLGRINEAVVSMEQGRARGLAEAMTFDAADPALIADEERRARYTTVRERLITTQADLHTSLPQDLDEASQRSLDLARTKGYREAKAAFDTIVNEIRAACDPADLLNVSLDAATLLLAAGRLGPRHALVYLASTPWGGIAVAVLGTQLSNVIPTRFAALDLPELTDELMKTLVETRLQDGTNRLIGGFAFAQLGSGFEQILQDWNGETFQEKTEAMYAACQEQQQSSALVAAIQEALTRSLFASLAERALTSLSQEERDLLDETLAEVFIQNELHRCLEILGTTALHATVAWMHEMGAASLTLIACGYLAAFPLTSIILPDSRSIGETVPTSIAPSARSLLRDRSDSSTSVRQGVFTLGDPTKNLPWSEAEALTLAKLARRHQLSGEVQLKEQATRTWLMTAFQRGQIVDASCHGSFKPRDILRSALLLANRERITMGEMLSHQADLRGLRLLILSGCQTAILDLEGARDEVHNLAAAMLQAGAHAVLASLWTVDDKATYLLMVRFAQEWFPHIDQESPAAALGRAQAWLRTVTNADLRYWKSTLPRIPQPRSDMDTASARQTSQKKGRRRGMQERLMTVRGRSTRYSGDDAQLVVRIGVENADPSACPYADPYYWAGFQVIGW